MAVIGGGLTGVVASLHLGPEGSHGAALRAGHRSPASPLPTWEGIDCDFARTGKLNQLVPKAELRREVGSDVFHGGMVESKSAGLHVGKCIRGLGEAAERAGVTIHEQAPVQS